MSVRTDTLAALDHEWRQASEVHRRAEHWHPRSTRAVLCDLVDEGAVERRTVPHPGGNVVHEYRLPQKETVK